MGLVEFGFIYINDSFDQKQLFAGNISHVSCFYIYHVFVDWLERLLPRRPLNLKANIYLDGFKILPKNLDPNPKWCGSMVNRLLRCSRQRAWRRTMMVRGLGPSPFIYPPLHRIAKECPRRDLNPHAITGNGF